MNLEDFKVGTVALHINGDIVIVTEINPSYAFPIICMKNANSIPKGHHISYFKQILGKIEVPENNIKPTTTDNSKVGDKILVVDHKGLITESTFIPHHRLLSWAFS